MCVCVWLILAIQHKYLLYSPVRPSACPQQSARWLCVVQQEVLEVVVVVELLVDGVSACHSEAVVKEGWGSPAELICVRYESSNRLVY